MKKIGLMVVLFLIIGAIPGWSICGPVDEWIETQASSDNYGIKTGGMLLRGVHRIVESPVELACHVYKGSTEDLRYGVGVLKGFGNGLLWMTDSILRGAWDIVTFAFPDYHGEPGTHKQECWGKDAGSTEAT